MNSIRKIIAFVGIFVLICPLTVGCKEESFADKSTQSFQQGVAKASEGDFEQAIEDYNEALSLNPNFANAYNSRANAHFQLQK